MSPQDAEYRRVLVVDDDTSARETLQHIMEGAGFIADTANSGEQALQKIREEDYGVVLTDQRMPGISGIELLRTIKELHPATEVVMMTAFATIELAVESMKEGAYDFVTKPLRKPLVLRSVSRAMEKYELSTENLRLRARLRNLEGAPLIVGNSAAMHKVMEVVSQVAASSATVLIQGASGTGKELIAKALHYMGPRASKSFVAINCASIPETLLESELFGHERGAFTGAISRREGRFKQADHGTLFLDEVAEMSPMLQAKLLRVLQEGTFERLGGNKTIQVDARLVSSTNKDLFQEVQAGRVREDLYYRLKVITIHLPRLRDRREDIPLLTQHFIEKYAAKNKKPITGISRDAMDMLMDHDWPGNVRELEHTVEHAVVLSRGQTIMADDLPELIEKEKNFRRYLTIQLGTPMDQIEQKVLEETLRMTRGNKKLAAELLGIATRTIYRKMEDKDRND